MSRLSSVIEPIRRAAAWMAVLVLFSLALALAAPGSAHAGCTVSVTNGSFGSIDVLGSGTANATATLSFSCTGMTPIVPVTLCANLDAGSGGSSGGNRLLTGPAGATAPFQIYQDAAMTQTWGTAALLTFGAAPTITVIPGLGGSASTTRTLYAHVTASSGTAAGSYSSTFSNQNFVYGLNLLSCAGITIGTSVTPAPFTFSGTVDPTCEISAGNLSFGNVGLLVSTLTAQSQLSVRCTTGSSWSLSLSNGQNGVSPTARKMAKGAERVTYGLYKDVAFSQAWGDVSQGPSWVQSGVGTGAQQSYTAYGRVPAQTTPSPGLYADTVVATVTY